MWRRIQKGGLIPCQEAWKSKLMTEIVLRERKRLDQEIAAKFGVSNEIHPDDHIYNFLINHAGFPTDTSRINYYFTDGKKSAGQIGDIISQCLPDTERPRVFEFASGYGCATRHLLKNQRINFTPCDIHPWAIDFLREKIGANATQSASIPEDVDPDRKFDVVFALSFFSHMPITTWARWLVKLSQVTALGGLLVFSTHALESIQHLGMDRPDEEFGYRFKPSSEQINIPVEEYGPNGRHAGFCGEADSYDRRRVAA
jgi:SAM-dependent methyltransferase